MANQPVCGKSCSLSQVNITDKFAEQRCGNILYLSAASIFRQVNIDLPLILVTEYNCFLMKITLGRLYKFFSKTSKTKERKRTVLITKNVLV